MRDVVWLGHWGNGPWPAFLENSYLLILRCSIARRSSLEGRTEREGYTRSKVSMVKRSKLFTARRATSFNSRRPSTVSIGKFGRQPSRDEKRDRCFSTNAAARSRPRSG